MCWQEECPNDEGRLWEDRDEGCLREDGEDGPGSSEQDDSECEDGMCKFTKVTHVYDVCVATMYVEMQSVLGSSPLFRPT